MILLQIYEIISKVSRPLPYLESFLIRVKSHIISIFLFRMIINNK